MAFAAGKILSRALRFASVEVMGTGVQLQPPQLEESIIFHTQTGVTNNTLLLPSSSSVVSYLQYLYALEAANGRFDFVVRNLDPTLTSQLVLGAGMSLGSGSSLQVPPSVANQYVLQVSTDGTFVTLHSVSSTGGGGSTPPPPNPAGPFNSPTVLIGPSGTGVITTYSLATSGINLVNGSYFIDVDCALYDTSNLTTAVIETRLFINVAANVVTFGPQVTQLVGAQAGFPSADVSISFSVAGSTVNISGNNTSADPIQWGLFFTVATTT